MQHRTHSPNTGANTDCYTSTYGYTGRNTVAATNGHSGKHRVSDSVANRNAARDTNRVADCHADRNTAATANLDSRTYCDASRPPLPNAVADSHTCSYSHASVHSLPDTTTYRNSNEQNIVSSSRPIRRRR